MKRGVLRWLFKEALVMHANTKGRLFGLFFFLFFLGATAYNWHLLLTERKYYLQASGLAPMAALISLTLVLSPSSFRPKPANKKSIWIMSVMGTLGLILGSVNFYLMDHYWQ